MIYRLCLLLACFFFSPMSGGESEKPLIAVSTTPYSGLLGSLLEDIALVHVCVPGTISAHTWEPNPQDVIRMKNVLLWFGTGEPFEKKLMRMLQEEQLPIHFIDLREGIEGLHESHSCHAHHGEIDPHIWMSPPKLLQQLDHIVLALKNAFPSSLALLDERFSRMKQDIQILHEEITRLLQPFERSVIVSSHNAFAYFCHEYRLTNLPIEHEGKELTPHELSTLLKKAQQAHVHTIFTQKQYPTRAAEQIGDALCARLEEVNPYSKEYLSMMREIAHAFAKEGALQKE